MSEAVVTVRRSRHGWLDIDFRELWAFRRLVYTLIWRDLKVRYRRTAIGFLWALIQPFVSMVVMTFFFGRLLKVPSDGVPYPIFAYAGTLPWQFFSGSFGGASSSLVKNRGMMSKIYFPRLLMPITAVLSGLPDFLIGCTILAGLMVYYHITPTLAVLLLPLAVLFSALAALSVALWLSALEVKFRDVRYMTGYIQQIWYFATPVIYPASMLPSAKLRTLYGLNPMAGVIETFRWALLGRQAPNFDMIMVSSLVMLLLLAGGVILFRRVERTATDRM